MQSDVIFTAHESQILKAVVVANPVDVVYMMTWGDWTVSIFPNESMLGDRPLTPRPIVPNHDVPLTGFVTPAFPVGALGSGATSIRPTCVACLGVPEDVTCGYENSGNWIPAQDTQVGLAFCCHVHTVAEQGN